MKNLHAAKVSFYVCLITSIALFVGGFFVPPVGVIDGSVITSSGVLLGFATLGVAGRAIDLGRTAVFKRGETQVSVTKEEETLEQCDEEVE